ncbi:hypothetical protein [Dysgonomonas sp. ZJ709]|uniref:hypothetical protein n=1 Tax=Dysgonomonas sp. ZJ709 TaxID=2709797 RepID=UPI0013ED9E1A|nr:hypothetical protein [Dysgonomonas sp. ZJ709]
MRLRNLFILFAVVGLLLPGFSSCSSDDDDDVIINPNGVYSAEKLELNGAKAAEGVKITIGEQVANAVDITLENVILGEPKLVLKGTLAQDGRNYTVKSTDMNENRNITVEGTTTGDKLTVKVITNVKSQLVGTWNLKITNVTSGDNQGKFADILFNIKTKDGGFMEEMIQGFVPLFAGKAIADKVESVTVIFNEDGTTKISYKELGGMTEYVITETIPISYYTDSKTNKLYLAVEKGAIDQLLETLKESLAGIDPAAIKVILIENGLYYTLPINVTIENSHAYFYISRDTVDRAEPLFDVIKGLLPPEMNLEPMVDIILTAPTLNFGLGFDKQ